MVHTNAHLCTFGVLGHKEVQEFNTHKQKNTTKELNKQKNCRKAYKETTNRKMKEKEQ